MIKFPLSPTLATAWVEEGSRRAPCPTQPDTPRARPSRGFLFGLLACQFAAIGAVALIAFWPG